MMPIAPQSRPDTRTLRERRQTASGIARAGAHLRRLSAACIDDYWDDDVSPSLSLHAVNQGDSLIGDAVASTTVGELLMASPKEVKKMTTRSRLELNRFLAKLGLGTLGSWRARK